MVVVVTREKQDLHPGWAQTLPAGADNQQKDLKKPHFKGFFIFRCATGVQRILFHGALTEFNLLFVHFLSDKN